MTREKRKTRILKRRVVRQRKKETSAVRRANAHALGRILRRRAKRREKAKERFWKIRPELSFVSREAAKQRGQISGFFEDKNLQGNPARQYFFEVMSLFKDRLPSKEFPRF